MATKKKISWQDRIMPRDIIAALVLLGAFYLKSLGADGTVSMVIAAIVGYYFSKRVFEEKVAK